MIQAYQLNCSDKLQIKMRFGSYECALIVNYPVSTSLNKYTIYMVILKGMALASTFILTLPSGFKSKWDSRALGRWSGKPPSHNIRVLQVYLSLCLTWANPQKLHVCLKLCLTWADPKKLLTWAYPQKLQVCLKLCLTWANPQKLQVWVRLFFTWANTQTLQVCLRFFFLL